MKPTRQSKGDVESVERKVIMHEPVQMKNVQFNAKLVQSKSYTVL